MIKGKELIKIILIVCAFIAIAFSIIYIIKIFILKYNNLYLTTMTNYGIQLLMLVIALYLLNKFNYIKYIKFSLKSFFELIVYTALLIILIIVLSNAFHIGHYFVWNTGNFMTILFQNFYFVFVALEEEYLFRVVLYYKVLETIVLKNKALKVIIAILLTNAIFSMSHFPITYLVHRGNMNITYFLNVFITGIFVSYLYLRTGNIYIPSVMHFIGDARIIELYPYNRLPIYVYFIDNIMVVSVIIIEIYNICKYFYNKNYKIIKYNNKNKC
ncbi:CPBP family intramembrane glutamic endopeptidase [Thermoanaerobacterium thermosaccharolyticum]|uniref:CAAX amino terminal protease family n=1 Tax=Thermoanaerobacterium thermosaccharolyticum M0795 TaxID=698948 RepID=L0IKX2_THETR|nr:CPBP family intramembrane glutamic endopeptidase [Thermoanaerobacterium thermosaccharolyticum]AGB18866.1 CAAX amino terminal protease family [Thermoanaerobacterium thermosaccharolyticum M0795]